jgi:hypothetical protein
MRGLPFAGPNQGGTLNARERALAALLTVARAAIAPVPALAHEVKIWHGERHVPRPDALIKACDNEPDGHGVRAY